jgi:hypothetical protein
MSVGLGTLNFGVVFLFSAESSLSNTLLQRVMQLSQM